MTFAFQSRLNLSNHLGQREPRIYYIFQRLKVEATKMPSYWGNIKMCLTPLSPRRRGVLASLIGTYVLLHSRLCGAMSMTGIDVLDSSAIRVRRPQKVLLESIVLAGKRLVAGGEHGVIIYSDDNGTTWMQSIVPVDVTLTCIGFATPMIGWAAGHFGVIINTNDGGKTWNAQLNGIQANQLTLVAAQEATAQNSVSPAVPLALTRAHIFVEDGPNKPFLTLLVISSQEVIVFGAYRMTMKTTNGGKTWVDWSLHIDDRVSHDLYGVASSGSSIYLVAESGLVFCANSFEGNFSPVTSPSDVTLLGVVCAQDGGVIVFGVAGSCFRSVDGGKTWTVIELQTQDNLTSGIRINSGAIVLGSQTGIVYVSNDNGATFASVPALPPISIFDLAEAPDAKLVFVGSSGITRLPVAILHR